jgi:hypothetical protein
MVLVTYAKASVSVRYWVLATYAKASVSERCCVLGEFESLDICDLCVKFLKKSDDGRTNTEGTDQRGSPPWRGWGWVKNIIITTNVSAKKNLTI